MKHFVNFFLLGLAVCLASLVGAIPAPSVDGLHAAIDQVDTRSTYHSFHVAVPRTADNLKARGYDPSTEWQQWATVEVWTGGNSRQPINFGDTRGANLSDKVFALLDSACPLGSTKFFGAGCHDHEWRHFWTNALIEGDPAWKVDLRQAYVRINGARYATAGIRIVLMRLVADTLRAFTRYSEGYNCYDVPGESDGIYCNVPQFVRVNLPWSSLAPKNPNEFSPVFQNYMHVETWGTDYYNQFAFTKGELRPCKTRKEVDNVMDRYVNDIVQEFPEYKGKFTREARVIINGDKVCSGEP